MEKQSTEMRRKAVKAVEGDREERGISKLSREIKELIFAKLPFESIYGSRIVCKEWNSILSSYSFLSYLPPQNPWLFYCGHENDGNLYCIAYCFSAKKWMTSSLSFLPNFEGDNVTDVSNISQGLLLLRETYTSRLLVCNLLMRSYAEIEMDLTDKFIHILKGRNQEPYLIVCSNSESLSFKIYHYFQDSWRIKCQYEGERWNNILQDEMVGMVEMVECNGILFWRGRSPASIAGYKIQDEGFMTPVRVAQLPHEMVHDLNVHVLTMLQPMSMHIFSMVSYGSSILVVGTSQEPSAALVFSIPPFDGAQPSFDRTDGLLGNIIHPTAGLQIQQLVGGTRLNRTGIVIWELFQDEEDELVWNWREFVRMPIQSLPEHLDRDWWHWKCVCVGDYLCFNSDWEAESATVYAYNLREGIWQLLPPCKSHNINWRMMGRMMSFEPNFNHYQFLGKST